MPTSVMRKFVCSLWLNEVSRLWMCPQRQPPSALYSCTSCCPTEYQPHGAAGRKPAREQSCRWEGPHYTGVTANFPSEPLPYGNPPQVAPILDVNIFIAKSKMLFQNGQQLRRCLRKDLIFFPDNGCAGFQFGEKGPEAKIALPRGVN